MAIDTERKDADENEWEMCSYLHCNPLQPTAELMRSGWQIEIPVIPVEWRNIDAWCARMRKRW